MTNHEIVSDPKILCGKPCIAGTRISVEFVLEELGAGVSIDEFVEQYPPLSREQVLTAVRAAAAALQAGTDAFPWRGVFTGTLSPSPVVRLPQETVLPPSRPLVPNLNWLPEREGVDD